MDNLPVWKQFKDFWLGLENKLEGWPDKILSVFLVGLGLLCIGIALGPSKILKAMLATYIIVP